MGQVYDPHRAVTYEKQRAIRWAIRQERRLLNHEVLYGGTGMESERVAGHAWSPEGLYFEIERWEFDDEYPQVTTGRWVPCRCTMTVLRAREIELILDNADTRAAHQLKAA